MLEDQIKVFTEAGYRVRAEVLNAADFGVAQERRRIFIVGLRSDLGMDYAFPVPTHGGEIPRTTIAQALAGIGCRYEGQYPRSRLAHRNTNRSWLMPQK